MHITSDLRLALPVRLAEVETTDPKNKNRKISEIVPLIWAYHVPISTEVFDHNYRIIANTKHALFSKGIAYAADNGPRIARLTLLDAARADSAEWGTEDSGEAFLGELKRLTTILVPDGNGFKPVPVDVAIGRKLIDPEEWAEAESALVFFTCAYLMAKRLGRQEVGEAMALVLRGSITSSSLTEFAASLQTSTIIADTGKSQVPS